MLSRSVLSLVHDHDDESRSGRTLRNRTQGREDAVAFAQRGNHDHVTVLPPGSLLIEDGASFRLGMSVQVFPNGG